MTTLTLSQDAASRLLHPLEVEEIRNLKLRYAHLLDTLDIDGLAELFTDDAVCQFGPYGEWEGKDVIRRNYHAAMTDVVNAPLGSIHHICNHCVDVQDDTHAMGRSYLIDVVTEQPAESNPVLCHGLYDERYEKIDGRWKISFSCIQFLWPERNTNDEVLAKFPPAASE